MSKETVEPEIILRGIGLKIAISIESLLLTVVFFSNGEQFFGERESDYLKIKKVTFGEKEARTRELLGIYHADLLKKYEKLLNRISKFVAFRNKLTHCPLTWKDRQPKTFIIWDTKLDQNKFEYLAPIEYSLNETYIYFDKLMGEVIPQLQSLSFKVRARLKISHPQIYKKIEEAYNDFEAN